MYCVHMGFIYRACKWIKLEVILQENTGGKVSGFHMLEC